VSEDWTLEELAEGETRIVGDKVYVQELMWKTPSKGSFGIIINGTDATVKRGTTYEHYMWIGTVEPENMVEYDFWVNPE
jgi:hypothetical protein